MCYGCFIDYTPVVNDRVIAAARLVEPVDPYGALHVIVDDFNIEDEHILSARDDGDLTSDDLALLDAFEKMTEDERASALALHDGFIDETGRDLVGGQG